MVFQVETEAGAILDAELIRPIEWVIEQRLEVGTPLEISIPELSAIGTGEVLAIEACPEIAFGNGNVVTGRYGTNNATELTKLR